MWKTLKRKPPQLADAPECPAELRYIWEWYREIFTGEPLTFSDIHYWSMPPVGPGLKGWERDLIKSLDRIFWKVHHG